MLTLTYSHQFDGSLVHYAGVEIQATNSKNELASPARKSAVPQAPRLSGTPPKTPPLNRGHHLMINDFGSSTAAPVWLAQSLMSPSLKSYWESLDTRDQPREVFCSAEFNGVSCLTVEGDHVLQRSRALPHPRADVLSAVLSSI
jgi:hypothetical protein